MSATLFDDSGRTIQERFESFHERHPEVYAEIVRLSRQVKSKGYDRYSIDAIIQRVRWHFQFERDAGSDFRLNDHFSSRYARLVMEYEPDLDGFFEVRRLKAS
jgi:hypothetical protein